MGSFKWTDKRWMNRKKTKVQILLTSIVLCFTGGIVGRSKNLKEVVIFEGLFWQRAINCDMTRQEKKDFELGVVNCGEVSRKCVRENNGKIWVSLVYLFVKTRLHNHSLYLVIKMFFLFQAQGRPMSHEKCISRFYVERGRREKLFIVTVSQLSLP